MKQSKREYLEATYADWFRDGGGAMSFEYRKQAEQMEFARRWLETIARAGDDPSERAHLAMISSDTGTGKSVAYLLPLLALAVTGERVAISTHSHQLQRQLIGTANQPGDLSKIQNWLKTSGRGDLRTARRVGQQGFVSAAAVRALVYSFRGEEVVSRSHRQGLEDLLDWAMAANAGKTSGLVEDAWSELEGRLPRNLLASQICLGRDAPPEDRDAYLKHLVASESADVIVITHRHLANCALFNGGRITDRGIFALVVDEADRLTDIAAQAFRFDVSLVRLLTIAKKLDSKTARSLETTVESLIALTQGAHRDQSAIALESLPNLRQSDLRNTARRAATQLNKVLTTLSNKAPGDTENWDLQQASEALRRFAGTQDNSIFASAISYSPTHKFPSLSVLPTNPGILLRKLWSSDDSADSPATRQRARAVLATSATLGIPGAASTAFAQFQQAAFALGLGTQTNGKVVPETSLWGHFEPAKFGSVRFILADPSVSTPVVSVDEDACAELSSDWLDYSASMVQEAQKSGRVLVHVRSFKDVGLLSERLEALGVQHVIAQAQGQTADDIKAAFVAVKDSIWISPSSWSGLNWPGLIQNVVIARLPFLSDDLLLRALLTSAGYYSKQSVDRLVSGIQMTAAKRLLRQGLGRGIRQASDKCSIWIADPRFPIPDASPLPLRYPREIRHGNHRTYPSLHQVIPTRFRTALERSSIFLKRGHMLVC